MGKEQSTRSEKDLVKSTPAETVPEEWFKMACYLASKGKQDEAELSIKNALNIRMDYPIAWAILSAILLSKGKETDAEQAGKKAISQCPELKITWPKMRTIIFSQGIVRGASWKDPRMVVIEVSNTTEWGRLLETLGKASKHDTKEMESSQQILDYKEESQKQNESLKEYTPTRKIDVTEKKKYESAETRFQKPEDRVDEEEKELEQMKTYASRRKIDRSEKKYESAQERFEDPEETDKIEKPLSKEGALVWLTAAEAHLKQGNLDGAEDSFLRALKIDPSKGEAWFRLSSIYMGKHKYDEAIVALKYATERLPRNAVAWFQLGYCYQKLNKWDDAITPLKQATLLDQVKPDYWMALGLSEFHLGEFQSASKSLLRVLRISPNNKNALFYLAMCMEKQGNRKHALSLYSKLLGFRGLEPMMLERMAGAFDRLNRPIEARESRRKAQEARRAGIS